MATEILTILPPATPSEEQAHIPYIGPRTLRLVNSLPISERSKETVLSEACQILSRCKFPGEEGSRTNIAVGYVQSGKTMSFTVLSALAADNGFKIIIYLTGTKTNLQKQTYDRLKSNFRIDGDYTSFTLFEDCLENSLPDISRIRNFILLDGCVLMFPILKHYQHIGTLADIFQSTTLAPLVKNKAILIIDDEADQSSFNTYARKNTRKEDWEEDEFSSTYASILKLRKSFDCHSYVQYTATPQAAFLIDSNDILAPEYHTVLTPGDDYTGGLFFFKNKERNFVETIKEDDLYHKERNPLRTMPKSLELSLKEFLISVAIKVFIKKDVKFLSMMIHVDGSRESNEKFCRWTSAKINNWIDRITSPHNDPSYTMFVSSLHEAYESISKYVNNRPSFEEVIAVLDKVMILTHIRLVQGDGPSSFYVERGDIDWEEAPAHILVGADMINRGFTVEKLSMTYMPRTTKGKSNADTIEQRCRFFGYKLKYADVCRIYVSAKSKTEYIDYVDHEEMLRKNLKQCSSVAEFTKMAKAMVLTNRLNPTRSNILSTKLVRDKLIGWRQLRTLDNFEANTREIDYMLERIPVDRFILCEDYDGNLARNHRYIKVDIESFIEFFKRIRYNEVPLITRKLVTIQYLRYLQEQGKIDHIRLYDIAYAAKGNDMRSHRIPNGKPANLMQGHSPDWVYPGDIYFKAEDTICFQIHHYRIVDPGFNGNKIACNFTIYYPEKLGTDYIALNSALEDDED